MVETDSFKEFVIEQLGGLNGLICRKMFDGYGLYQHRTFFGIVHKGRLYFKTSAKNRQKYIEQGMDMFRPSAKQTLKNYYEVPVDVVEDHDELVRWAEEAVNL